MEETRFWILAAKKISGELSAEESGELELLLLGNSNYNHILSSVQNPVSPDPASPSFDQHELLQRLREKLTAAGTDYPVYNNAENDVNENNYSGLKPRRFSIRLQMLAALLIVITAGIFSWKLYNKPANLAAANTSNNILTKPGSKTQIKLPDGTLVTLNADSKLSYPDNFLGNTREVNLDGEAFFEVAHNAEKPFIVHTKLMDIKVLGTVFDVRSYEEDNVSEASLLKGSIQVTLKNRKDEKIMLVPNEKISVSNLATFDSTGEKEISPVGKQSADGTTIPAISIDKINYDAKDQVVNEVAWTQNKLVFNNEYFEKIAMILERWYGKQIIIKDEKLKEQRFTGKFKNETIEQVLKAFQLTYSFKYKIENNIITIY